MGDTFAKVGEVREQISLKENVSMIKDHIWMSSEKEFKDSKYIFVIEKQENFGAAATSNWDGTINIIRKLIQDKLDAHKSKID
eukprot:CAMPEP_0116886800 /NCGR_PEP_ID=MMETSP0463-20121206/20757_1 /TAXON_ID=181622 /ORGANISM="Strombidinopsis sp, Strain SopsisLIS2011" /LENGTH=82 /DNA_ID=CAMNT_0004547797 /DNA_START=611 /DNA_END=859 /DNA_ORIENTATION=+